MGGILAYGTYVPYFRLQRKAIAEALGTSGGEGTRAVASHDEDTTSMGVEAGRAALAEIPSDIAPRSVYFATSEPAYLDKTNAAAIQAALRLNNDVLAVDMVGAVRSGVGAIRAGLDSPSPALVVLSDIRTGLPGGSDEREGGDGAAALLCTNDASAPVIAEYLGGASATAEFLERWRIPGDRASHQWEERFGEHAYGSLAEQALTDAFKATATTPDGVDHFIATGTHRRSVGRILRGAGARPEAVTPNLTDVIGNTGTAHPAILLASVLERASPNELIALVVIADGASVLLFRTTELVRVRDPKTCVSDQIASGRDDLGYQTFLTWRGMLHREPPRRPDPVPPAAPPSFRTEDWKFAFTGSRCEMCGTRHLPPQRTCLKCHAIDQMKPEPLADVPAKIATFTVDRLAYSLSPPVVVAVLDFDGGGRYQCELTDVDPSSISIGDRVEMTFRRFFTANSVHNYFWKARPIRGRT